jgi:cytochrome c oxidase assembly protein subunit 15
VTTSSTLTNDTSRGRWAYGLALCAALFAIPLVIFGGSVTTLGAGLAVEGWLVAEGHFMLFLPIDTWIGDTHRFVEHVHRIFGTIVGLFAVGSCVMAWLASKRGAQTKSSAVLATTALLAVIVQGVIGGQRVELFSDDLAFLHGALAQAVLAMLFVAALVLSARWRNSNADNGGDGKEQGVTPRGLAMTAVVVTYLQIVFGAAYRHALRPDDNPEAVGLLYVHLFVALIVFGVLLLLCRKLKEASTVNGAGEHLARQAQRIHMLLGLQILLGLMAWMGYRPGSLAPLEWALSVLHVLVGGLLLAQVVASAMWSSKLAPRRVIREVTRNDKGAAPAPVGGNA